MSRRSERIPEQNWGSRGVGHKRWGSAVRPGRGHPCTLRVRESARGKAAGSARLPPLELLPSPFQHLPRLTTLAGASGSWVGGHMGSHRHSRCCPYPERKEDNKHVVVREVRE